MRLKLDSRSLAGKMARMVQGNRHAIARSCEVTAIEMERFAKRYAPWKNRTGLARATMEGLSGMEDGNYYCIICGKMSYSPKLEFAYRRRYQILYPTVRFFSDKLYRQIKDNLMGVGAMTIV